MRAAVEMVGLGPADEGVTLVIELVGLAVGRVETRVEWVREAFKGTLEELDRKPLLSLQIHRHPSQQLRVGQKLRLQFA